MAGFLTGWIPMRRSSLFVPVVLGCCSLLLGLSGAAEEPKEKSGEAPMPAPKQTTLAKNPKPLSDKAKSGIEFLVKRQQGDGSWNGGPGAAAFERATGKGGGIDVANTSIGALALLRAGYSPKQGPYAENIRKAIDRVLK